ncbi:MAG: TRAP transporter small permease subunit [Pseudomonadota bacterium]
MLDGILWFFTELSAAAINIAWAILNPSDWLGWLSGLETTEAKEALLRFVYFGGSVEFFFAVLLILTVVTIVGVLNRSFMWAVVRFFEGIANTIGRYAAWAGLLMVLQQVVVVFIQRIFAQSQLSVGFGINFSRDISWWSEELKLFNAIVVCLCCSYTFVQRGHVRVDLVYASVSYRKKRIIDMLGSLLFMMPMAIVIWMYGWYFMWRHLINPPVSASDTFERMMAKARAVRWSVETIAFSPNGFDAYFLFKVLMVLFAGLVFLQAVAFLYRSYLELVEGEASEGRYDDIDVLEDHVFDAEVKKS